MTAQPRIELVYFEGCPNAAEARDRLVEATRRIYGTSVGWTEWDLMATDTPPMMKQYGSPTVLVDGEDVTGDGRRGDAMACRADGAPTVEAITGKILSTTR